jgi:hypothetical protein
MQPFAVRSEYDDRIRRAVDRAEPMRCPGAELGGFAGFDGEVPVAEDEPKFTGEHVEPVLAPPWAWKLGHDHHFPAAVGPAGQVGTVTDNVIVLRRASHSCRVVEDESERVPLS